MGRFEKYLTDPTGGGVAPAAPTAPAPPISGAPAPSRFQKYLAPGGFNAPVAPVSKDGVDWSKYNKPLGEMKADDPSYRERIIHGGQDALMALGMKPYDARHFSEGTINSASINPMMGGILSGVDLAYDATRGNYGHAALDALGVAPGVWNTYRKVTGIPKMRMADIPADAELKAASKGRYDDVAAVPFDYHPNSMEDLVENHIKRQFASGNGPRFNELKAPSIYAEMDRAVAKAKREGRPLTADDFDTLRQNLRGGVPGTKDAAAGAAAINILDKYQAQPPFHMVLKGGQPELDLINQGLADARGNYRGYANSSLVQGKVDTAAIDSATKNSGANLDNTTRQYLKGLATTKAGQRASAGMYDEEKQAVVDAAKGDWLTNMLRYGGKFLGGGGGWGQAATSSIGGGLGGTVAHVLGADPVTASGIGTMATGGVIVGGAGLRGAADARTVRAAEAVADKIRMNTPLFRAREAATPPIADPAAMQRDAIAYALTPQVKQQAGNVWDQSHVPFENRDNNPEAGRNLEPPVFGGYSLPDRSVERPAIPRVYIDQPAESYDPNLE